MVIFLRICYILLTVLHVLLPVIVFLILFLIFPAKPQVKPPCMLLAYLGTLYTV